MLRIFSLETLRPKPEEKGNLSRRNLITSVRVSLDFPYTASLLSMGDLAKDIDLKALDPDTSKPCCRNCLKTKLCTQISEMASFFTPAVLFIKTILICRVLSWGPPFTKP